MQTPTRLLLKSTMLSAFAAMIVLGAPSGAYAQATPSADSRALATGTITGTIVKPPAGKTNEGITVAIVETGQTTKTDKYGQYTFSEVKPGTYTIVASGPGYSRLRITDVVVQPNHTVTLSAQEMPIVMKDGEVQMMEEVVVSAKKENVEVMEKYLVTESNQQPFTATNNIDLPRGVNDVQPYYIFDAAKIETSGATDIQDFFQRNVPMDTNHSPENSMFNTSGNHSNINIGGIGNNSGGVTGGTVNTLVLVDGRPLPGYMYVNTVSQGDVNGIPLSSIDHIEVLTASASAIYGASAAGGVINIVTKRDFSGGQIKYSYTNTFDTDSPTKNVSLNWGASLEGGRTHITFSASYQTQKPLFTQDRLNVIYHNLDRYYSLYPHGELAALGLISSVTGLFTATSSAQLSQPTITSTALAPLFAGNGATTIQVPAGYGGYPAAGLAPLQANIGNFNVSSPNNGYYRLPIGLMFPQIQGPTQKGMNLLVRRQMASWIEAYAQIAPTTNFSLEPGDSFTMNVTVPATVPGNPFGQTVRVAGSMHSDLGPELVNIVGRRFSTGATLTLPDSWKGNLDYTWGTSHYLLYSPQPNTTSMIAAINSGALNVIRDLAMYPFSALAYADLLEVYQNSTDNNLQFKMAGPLPKLWAGTPTLAVGVGHEKKGNSGGRRFDYYPSNATTAGVAATATLNQTIYYTGQFNNDDDAYTELQLPLVSRANHIPLVDSLQLQVSGRVDRNSSHTTSPAQAVVANLINGTSTYSPLTSGQPQPFITNPVGRFTTRSMVSGLKYSPIDGVTLRWSYSSGFIAPTYSQLLVPLSTGTQNEPTSPANEINPSVPTTSPWGYSLITDPQLGNTQYFVPVESGGNPNLKPESSKGLNWGVILEPKFVKGLRLSLDYSKTTKHDSIVAPGTTILINNPSAFPGRVVRTTPAAGQTVGAIVFIDNTNLNAPETVTSTYNFTGSYVFQLSQLGTFTVTGTGSAWQHYKIQSIFGGPLVEQLSNPNASNATNPATGSGAGLARFKGNLGVDWTRGSWAAGWLARYTGPYAEGFNYGLGGGFPFYTGTYGGWISSQIYHDVYVSYRVGRAGASSPWWMRTLANTKVLFGVHNVFNKAPPYDALDAYNADYSTYGDLRLATYNLSVSKEF